MAVMPGTRVHQLQNTTLEQPHLDYLHHDIRKQVAAMLEVNYAAGLRIEPLLLPQGGTMRAPSSASATSFVMEFWHCLQRIRWQVIMQRCGLSWVPDIVTSESTFQPLQGGSGGSAYADALQQLLKSATNQYNVDAAPPSVHAASQRLAEVMKLLLLSYQEHHCSRVATAAAMDTRMQFELDTTDSEGRQLMLIKTAGCSTQVLMLHRLPALDLGHLLDPPVPAPPRQPSFPSPQLSPLPPKAAGVGQSRSSKAFRYVRSKKSPAGPEEVQAPPTAPVVSPLPPPPPLLVPPPVSAAAIEAGAAMSDQVRIMAAFTADEGGKVSGAEQSWASRAGSRARESAPQLELQLPPQLLGLLGQQPGLPPWTEGMCLMEFLPLAAAALQSAVDCAVANRSQRLSLINAVIDMAGPAAACDHETWRDASWLVSIQGIVVQLLLSFPQNFPTAPPKLTLQAANDDAGAVARELAAVTYSDYGWSPRWDGSEGAQRIFEHLEGAAPQWRQKIQVVLGAPGGGGHPASTANQGW